MVTPNSASMTRRRALVIPAFALPSIGLVGSPARAVAIAGALAAAAAIAGIIGSIAGILAESDRKRKLEEINGKLDAILVVEVQILKEIKDFHLFLEHSIAEIWPGEYRREILAQKDLFEIYVTRRTPNLKEFESLYTAALPVAFKLGGFDFSGFPFFGIAVTYVLASYSVVRYDRREWAKTQEKFALILDNWLKQIAAAIQLGENETQVARQKLSASPRTVEVRRFRETTEDDGQVLCTETVIESANIIGSIEAGFSFGSLSTDRKDRRCKTIPICKPSQCSLVNEQAKVETELALLLRPNKLITQSVDDLPKIPTFSASGYDAIDALNHDRIELFRGEFELATKKVWQKRMLETRDALRKPLAHM